MARASDELAATDTGPAGVAALARAAAGGSRRAFDELYRTHVERVHRTLAAMVRSDAEVDDLVQATFVQAYRQLASFRGDAAFATWLHRICINVALTHFRTRSRWRRFRERHAQHQEVVRREGETPHDAVQRQETMDRLQQLLDRLKPDKRLVLVLYEIEGRTLSEIAELVEAPLNTVATRLRTARLEIRRAALKMGYGERAPGPARPWASDGEESGAVR